MLVRPLLLGSGVFGGSSFATTGINAAFPITALADPQPKVVVQTNLQAGVNTLMIEVDLGADTSFDTVAVLYANLSPAATWTVYGRIQAAGFGAIGTENSTYLILGSATYGPFGVAPTTTRSRRHAFVTGAAVTLRYLRIYLKDTAANVEQVIRVGNVVIGSNVMPAALEKNFELDSARGVADLSVIEQLDGGELAIQRKARVPKWQGRWSNLDDTEARAVYALLDEVGESGPVVLIENADAVAGQAEAIHYGVLRDLELISRPQTSKNAVGVKLVDWL